MTLRDIRTRKRLHELDRTKASYPTVARTGDKNRNGKFPLVFDDTNTVIFKSNASISYPTTFETGSKYLTSDLRSDITILRTGTVNPSAVDPWLVRSYTSEPHAAFNENKIFEYDMQNSKFFLTGSKNEDVGMGFTSNLSSKTIIRFDLPMASRYTLLDTTASAYYYDVSSRTFVRIPNTNQYSPGGGLGFNGDTVNHPRNIPQPREELLFGPLGKYSSNVLNIGTVLSQAPPPLRVTEVFFNNLATTNLNLSTTTPSASHQISLNTMINQPFLLEKCVIELPFEAGPGWFNDRTMVSCIDENVIDPDYYTDIGGPAITVGLFNSFGTTKDLILSATIVPSPDNVKSLTLNNVHNPPFSSSISRVIRTPSGFATFSTPGVVVNRPNTTTQQFSGSVKIEIEPFASTGISTLFHRLAPGFVEQLYFNSSFERSSIFIQTVCGRSKVGGLENLTGRTIFGRTTSTPSFVEIPNPSLSLHVASGTSGVNEDIVYYTTEKHSKAPYLLFPQDKLFLTLSKYRSAFVSSSNFSNPPSRSQATNEPNALYWFYHSSSHDVSIPTGTIRLTLYGSLVRENSEFHDTLNSRLDTEQIHEMIGSEPIVDVFDVFYSTELSGSTIDRFMTGSILTKTSLARQRVFSLSGIDDTRKTLVNGEKGVPFDDVSLSKMLTPRAEIATNFRNIQCSSSEERFWDSMVPNIIDITRINNGTIQVNSSFASTQVSNEISLDTESASCDKVWTKSFPFESKYSTVARVNQDKLRFKISNDTVFRSVENQFTIGLRPGVVGGSPAGTNFSDTSPANFRDHKDTTGYSTLQTGLLTTDLFKIYFGIGDLNTMYSSSLGAGYIGSTQLASYRVKAHDQTQNWDYLHKPLIRGWKYGLASGLPLFTKAVFARNRYGFMRDMLEQRIDTKFLAQGMNIRATDSVIRVRFVNSSGDSVRPEETFSSNLSLEVTSSLPYFDDEVRNREEPIAFARANQSIVVI